MALTFAASVVLMPDISYYNKVLLLPSLLTVITVGDYGRRFQRLARYLTLLAVSTPLLTMTSAGLLYVCGVAVGVASAITAALMLSQLMGAFFLLMPALVLPAAICCASGDAGSVSSIDSEVIRPGEPVIVEAAA
jgi:hypothetical protein